MYKARMRTGAYERPWLLFTGSRTIPTTDAMTIVRRFLDEHSTPDTIHLVGDAPGVDVAAAAVVRGLRRACIQVSPPWAHDGHEAGLLRNEWMVADLLPLTAFAEEPAGVCAIWDGHSGGTAQCMRIAHEWGFPIHLWRFGSSTAFERY